MEYNKEIKTPKNKVRSLGLRLSAQKSITKKTPLSDCKSSFHSLQLSSPLTPKLAQTSGSSSSNKSLPYRLSLSRTVRDNYKKKKLEFAASQLQDESENISSLEQNECHPSDDQQAMTVEDKPTLKEETFSTEKLPTELQQEIIEKEKILQRHRKHQEKVKELKDLIAIWTEAFTASLEELSSKFEPRIETDDLLARLGLPPNLIDLT